MANKDLTPSGFRLDTSDVRYEGAPTQEEQIEGDLNAMAAKCREKTSMNQAFLPTHSQALPTEADSPSAEASADKQDTSPA